MLINIKYSYCLLLSAVVYQYKCYTLQAMLQLYCSSRYLISDSAILLLRILPLWELQQKHMVIAINKIVYVYIIGEYLFIDDIIQFEIFKMVIDVDNIVYPNIILRILICQ